MNSERESTQKGRLKAEDHEFICEDDEPKMSRIIPVAMD